MSTFHGRLEAGPWSISVSRRIKEQHLVNLVFGHVLPGTEFLFQFLAPPSLVLQLPVTRVWVPHLLH